MSSTPLSTVLTLAGLLALAGQAQAQFAIGQGNALDRNLRRGDTRANPQARDFRAEMRFRDAIVTGNAAGGFSFRGDVGYRAAEDFRSPVAADTTYGFRRDSILSGLGGLGVRGTDAIQYQYALTTGNSLPNQFTGALRTRRFGGGAIEPSAREGRIPSLDAETADVLSRRVNEDLFRDERGSYVPVRSTSAYTTTKSYLPTLVSAFGTPDGRAIAQTASPLRGIETFEMGRVEDIRPDLIPQGLRPKTGPEEPRAGSIPTVRDEPGLNFNEELMRRYDSYLDWQKGSGGKDGVKMPDKEGWRDNIMTIREFLNQPPPDHEQFEPKEGEGEGEGEAEPGPGLKVPGLAPEILDLIREGPGRMDSLLLTDPDQVDAYGAHIKAGERLLEEGRYFDAEERFTRALEHKQGDTFALAGRIHAQIGSGMYVSAALNLRNLVRDHPETAGIRFGEELLPQSSRLTLVVDELRGKVEAERMQDDASLLLAYIGYQTRDAALTEEGLEGFEAHGSDAPLAAFVREVWAGSR